MTSDTKNTQELIQIMQGAILQYVANQSQEQPLDFLMLVETLLLEIISTAINLVEIHRPGSALIIYTDMEAAMKIGGLRQVSSASANHNNAHPSKSTIDANDTITGMNYIGQQLAITLFKGLNELPMSLRNEDMMLRSIEALLVTLLNQYFTQNAHQVLDRLCEHVHLALNDLTTREGY